MGYERTTVLRRVLIALMLIALIAVSAGIGLVVANWPDWVGHLADGS